MKKNIAYLFLLLFINSPSYSQNWVQEGETIVGADLDLLGEDVEISGNGSTIAVGARTNDANGLYHSGAVKIYRRTSDGAWTQIGQTIGGVNETDHSGASVSLSYDGNTVAIGSPYYGANTGLIRIFKYDGGLNWVKFGNDIVGDYANSHFGDKDRVRLNDNGSRLFVSGVRTENGIEGSLKVFDITDEVFQVGQTISGFSIFHTIATNMFGNKVAIASYDETNDNGENAGTTRIYELIGEFWTQIGQDIYGEAAGDYSGQAISFDGHGIRIAIGSKYNSGNGFQSGHVRIYNSGTDRFGNAVWRKLVPDIDGEGENDRFGATLEMSQVSRLVVGSESTGEVKIFHEPEYNRWIRYGSVISPLEGYGGYLDVSIDNNGEKVIIGDKTYLSSSGGARIFSISPLNYSNCPSAQDFNFSVNPGQTLNISSDKGILSNSSNFWSDETFITLVEQPVHGNLILNQDGSFSYTHDGSLSTHDVFTYFINDGVCNSLPRSVVIDVNHPMRNDGNWIQDGEDIKLSATTPLRGVSLSKNGSVLAVGDVHYDSGSIKIYNKIGLDWILDQTIYSGGWNFGSSVDISGDGKTVVGANIGSSVMPYVSVFRKGSSDNETWIKMGDDILIDTTGHPPCCTYSLQHQVSISYDGNIVAISVPGSNGGIGEVLAYQWIENSWIKISENINGDDIDDFFGKWRQLDMSGDGTTIIAGSTQQDVTGEKKGGYIKVFKKNNLNEWMQIGQTIYGDSLNDGSGRVSINYDGSIIAVGNIYDKGLALNSSTSFNRGAVKTFRFDGATWIQRGQELTGNTVGDIFGGKISLSDSGDTLAIGAAWSDTRGNNTGQVKVVRFDKNTSRWKQIGADLYGRKSGEYIGYVLKISGDGSKFVTRNQGPENVIKVYRYNQDNVCPDVDNDEYDVAHGTFKDFTTFENSLIYNDYDANDSLKATHNSLPSHGTIGCGVISDPRYGQINVICENGQFTYTHNPNSLNRFDSFTYKVNDGTCDSEIATVKINITDFPLDINGSWFEEKIIPDTSNNNIESVLLSDDGKILFVSKRGSTDQYGNIIQKGGVTFYTKNNYDNTWYDFTGAVDVRNEYKTDFELNKNSTVDAPSIALSSDGKFLAVGSPSYGVTNGAYYEGTVQVYEVLSQYTNPMLRLIAEFSGKTYSSRTGASVAIESDENGQILLAIGSPGMTGNDIGQVDLYIGYSYYSYLDDWHNISTISSGVSTDRFGTTLSMSNFNSNTARLAVGAPASTGTDQVRVYEIYTQTLGYTNIGQFGIPNAGVATRQGGISLSGDGRSLVIGLPFNDLAGFTDNGSILFYVFNSGSNTWNFTGEVSGPRSDNQYFGYSVSLNEDGSLLAVGVPGAVSPYETCSDNYKQGHAEIYKITNNGNSWVKAGNNITGDIITGTSIGHSVSLSSSGQEVAVASGIYKLIGNTCVDIQSDYYGLMRGTTINKNASQGLLSNDSDAEGDMLKAYLLNDTKHGFISCQDPSDPNFGKSGSVCLNGSFTYSHDGSSSTVDTLMYKVYDGGCTSESFAILSIDGSLDDKEWTKVGQTLVGEGEEDYFGFVSMNAEGDIMAVGAPENSNLGGISAGHVRVFKNVEDTWTQLGQDIDGKSQDEYMGVSVAISDDGYTLVMGSGYGVNEEKTVRVYKFSNNTWVQIGDDISEPVGEEECFGCKVEISGDGSLIAIADDEEGEIQLYRNNGSTITAIDILYNSVNNGDEFNNMSMSSDGSKIAFINGETANYGEGIVMVYNYSLNGNWSQVGNNIDHLLEGITADYVQISGDGKTVVIGFSSIDNDYCDAYRFVRAYKFVENQNKWIQIGNDVARDKGYSADIDYFGSRIAISGEYGVFTYELKGESWMQIGQTLKGENEDWYEGSISFNKDGSRLALGLAESDYNTNGKVEVYSYPTSALPPPVLTNTVVKFIYTSSTNEEGSEKDIFIQLNNPNKDVVTTVDVVLTNGNLEDIDDFASKTLTFPAGTYDSAIQKITINITDDSIEEGDEEIVLSLQNASGSATIGPNSTFTLTIIDNDGLFITGLEEIGVEKNINIYPNPTSGILNINFNGAWKGDVTLKIFDTFGKEELRNTIQNNSGNSEIELDVSNRKNGIFFIELIQGDKKLVKKIIKK